MTWLRAHGFESGLHLATKFMLDLPEIVVPCDQRMCVMFASSILQLRSLHAVIYGKLLAQDNLFSKG